MTIVLNILIILNSYFLSGHFNNNLFLELYEDNLEFIINIIKFSILQLFFICSLDFKINIELVFVYLLEFVILLILVIEDETAMEISSVYLLYLTIVKLLQFFISRSVFSPLTFLFANFIFLIIFLLSKGGIGMGDIILNFALSFTFNSVLEYYRFFTLSFSIGAVYSSYLILVKNYTCKSKIGFVKFLTASYYISIIMR